MAYAYSVGLFLISISFLVGLLRASGQGCGANAVPRFFVPVCRRGRPRASPLPNQTRKLYIIIFINPKNKTIMKKQRLLLALFVARIGSVKGAEVDF